MEYHIKASSHSEQDAVVHIKQSHIDFGTTLKTAETLPNPAELFLGSFASCILKNVERFADLMKFTYSAATIDVKATRLENPPRMDNIVYSLTIYSSDKKLNLELLKKNIEKFGTIFNTVKSSCTISGSVSILDHV
jgi:uncharacterized OsmC-like protein